MWGKTKKEYTTVVKCYPVEQQDSQPVASEIELPRRRTKAKRKLVNNGVSLLFPTAICDYVPYQLIE